ncbi:DUF2059 domain-containing protein [Aquabacterium sp. A7-Y]|uniref:DUF2059 domain-containing protein n=1 Tax=Aquabacterium sp. A7-Y TaxID=1349605 RepID=UPI00223DDEE3|nr:DUF2059 domain-containing protein [Aquabacterium sp. A7-Y]MCW7536498.1 DUF2059 domain-containing protein [Aquabacterium sp. A7-Y]
MSTSRVLACSALVLALGGLAVPAQAQTKKELVQKLLQMQQPAVENMARRIAEQPAVELMQEAGRLLKTQVPEAKRQEVAKAIEADLKKYAEQATPLVRDKALKLAPTTLGSALEEKFSEDELKQVIAWLESPAYKKYQQVLPEVERNLTQKLVEETRPAVEPKIRTLQASIRKHLGLPDQPPATPAAGAKPKK